MDNFTPFDVLSLALGGDMKKLPALVENYLAPFNVLNVDNFAFDPDLLEDFTYEQMEDYVGIQPLAAIVDPDSDPIPFADKGKSLGTGKIPRMKVADYYNEAKLRTLYKLQRRVDISAGMLRNKAEVTVGELLVKRASSFYNQLSYQRDQMVSTGKIVYNSTNNPYGIALELSGRIPAGNIKIQSTSAKKWWSNTSRTTEGANADPVQDMKDMVEAAKLVGCTACHFEINDVYLSAVLKHSKVIADLKERFTIGTGTTVTTLKFFSDEELVAALAAIVGKPIVVRKRIASVEYTDANGDIAERSFSTFNENVIALVPDGEFGKVLTVEPLLLNGGTYAYALGRRIAFTFENNYIKKAQSIVGEQTSLCVPSQPKWMWLYFPNNN